MIWQGTQALPPSKGRGKKIKENSSAKAFGCPIKGFESDRTGNKGECPHHHPKD